MGDVISCAAVTTVIAENSLQSAFFACRSALANDNASPRRRSSAGPAFEGKKAKAKKKKEEEAKWSRGVTYGLLRIVTVPPACHSK